MTSLIITIPEGRISLRNYAPAITHITSVVITYIEDFYEFFSREFIKINYIRGPPQQVIA